MWASALLPGCAPTPARSGGSQPATSVQPAGSPTSSPTGVWADVLPADVAVCAPPPNETPWIETGRTTDAGTTYAIIEPSDSVKSGLFAPAIVRLSGGTCESYVMYETDGGSDTDVTPPSPDAMDRLLDGSFAWRVAQSGSVQAYADAERAFNGGLLDECPPDEDLGPCVVPWLALRFRGAGIDVGVDR